MAGRFSIEAVFKAIDRVTAPVSRMQNRVGKFTRSMSSGFRKLNRTLDNLSGKIKKTGIAAVAAFTLAAVPLYNILHTGADFEQAITNVGAVSLKTRDQIKPLEQLALKLGKTTKFTATQAANAMEIMSRAGFKNNEILKATPAVLAAAAASGMEIADVADVVSNALKGMGLEADQAANVADILTLASSRTNSTIGSLGESLKNVASTARQLNIPIEQTVAAIAELQDVGLDASVAGSAFNVMLTKMAAPSAGMIKKMKRFGISFKDAKGNMLPLEKVLAQLNVASDKAGGNFNKVAFLAELVGLRGQKAAANLADLFKKGKIQELTKELQHAQGAAKKMADIRMNTLEGSMLLLGSAIDGVKVKIFGLTGGPLKKVVDQMTAWVDANGEMMASKIGDFLLYIINHISEIVTWIERIGKALAIFFIFTTVLKTLATILTVVNLLMAANPITLMVLGVIALTGFIVFLVNKVDELAASFDSMNPILRALLTPFEMIIRSIKAIKDAGNFIGTGLGKWLFNVTQSDQTDQQTTKATPQVVSPQERTANTITENTNTNKSEVTIKAPPGMATVTGGKMGNGLNLMESGAF